MFNFRISVISVVAMVALTANAWAGPKDDVAFLPSDTQLFFQLDFEGLKKTPIFREMVSKNPMYVSGLAEVKKMTGIDLNTDVKTVTMGLLKSNSPDAVIVIIDAPLKVDSPAMKEAGIEKRTIAGKTYYRVGSSKDGAVANFKGRTLLTQEKRIREILTGKSGLPKGLAKLAAERNPKAQLWVFGTPPERAMQGAPFRPENVYGAIDVSTGMNIILAADTTPEFASQAMAEFTREKSKLTGNPQLKAMGLSAMVEKVKLTSKGKRITLSLSLNAAEMNQVTSIIKMMMMAQGSAGPNSPMPMAPPKMPVPPPTGTTIQKKSPKTP